MQGNLPAVPPRCRLPRWARGQYRHRRRKAMFPLAANLPLLCFFGLWVRGKRQKWFIQQSAFGLSIVVHGGGRSSSTGPMMMLNMCMSRVCRKREQRARSSFF